MVRQRILVIDDDPLFRSLLTSMLPRECVVSTAAEGSEGYYTALEHPPHLAIIDIRMPGWDGLRTLRAFRGHQSLARTPLMVMTSDSSRETLTAAQEAGADDFVIKTTLERTDLLSKVERLLARAAEPAVPRARPSVPPEATELIVAVEPTEIDRPALALQPAADSRD